MKHLTWPAQLGYGRYTCHTTDIHHIEVSTVPTTNVEPEHDGFQRTSPFQRFCQTTHLNLR